MQIGEKATRMHISGVCKLQRTLVTPEFGVTSPHMRWRVRFNLKFLRARDILFLYSFFGRGRQTLPGLEGNVVAGPHRGNWETRCKPSIG